MQFYITIQIDRKRSRYLVEYQLISRTEECFKVIARNGSITFSSNRPLFRNKGINKRKPDLRVIEGQLKSKSVEEMLVNQIQAFIERTLEKN